MWDSSPPPKSAPTCYVTATLTQGYFLSAECFSTEKRELFQRQCLWLLNLVTCRYMRQTGGSLYDGLSGQRLYTLFNQTNNRLPWVIWGHFTSASLTLQHLCPVKLLHSYVLVVLAMWKVRFFLQLLCFPAWTEHGVQKSLKKAFGNSAWNLFFIH